ncbi:hypothetical protein MHM84_03825 [Halomonas sp. McH1-25]|uniref:hypothetical protein n=1 Tax=unclassified Halomonas TaxID=2609666 RepID=UPI001EF41C67|nr:MULTISPECIES: hypothetical protein [unclassified Halomonas]MCG7598902.1 hypothetical protein [Halomonas sp. McH1-25]MCP1340865.1 hypothetical protein [Halomonas sp. FL8]MCP1361252.1 hypothetical protein [Halomonas sp. BBD45]MCP1366194.1 hypothetical protein [Halomonas sp. BBD48]
MLIHQSPAIRRIAENKMRRMDEDAQRYRRTQWRKALERKGWRNAHRFPAPQGDWIEYHALWKGWLYSGRCRLSDFDWHDWDKPGTHVYLIKRLFEVEEAVWRRTRKEVAGQVVRRFTS